MISLRNETKARWTARAQFSMRYLAVGGVNALAGFTLFPLLQTLLGPAGVHYMVTLCISQLLCVSISYVTMRRFVFSGSHASFRQFFLHGAFYWVYFLFNLMALPLIVEKSAYDPRVVQLLLTVFGTAIAVLWQTRVVFRRDKSGNV